MILMSGEKKTLHEIERPSWQAMKPEDIKK